MYNDQKTTGIYFFYICRKILFVESRRSQLQVIPQLHLVVSKLLGLYLDTVKGKSLAWKGNFKEAESKRETIRDSIGKRSLYTSTERTNAAPMEGCSSKWSLLKISIKLNSNAGVTVHQL